jgi:Cysteine-rich CPXCG
MLEEVTVQCPGCGEAVSLEVDTSGGTEQVYVEDCPVCCRPMEVRARCRPGEVVSLAVTAA